MRYKTLLFLIIPIITQLSVIDTSFAEIKRCSESGQTCASDDCFASGSESEFENGTYNNPFYCNASGDRSCLNGDKVLVLGDVTWGYDEDYKRKRDDSIKKYSVRTCIKSFWNDYWKADDPVSLKICNTGYSIGSDKLSSDWDFRRKQNYGDRSCHPGHACYVTAIDCVYCKDDNKVYDPNKKKCVYQCTYITHSLSTGNEIALQLDNEKHHYINCSDVNDAMIKSNGETCVVYCNDGKTEYGVLECKRGYTPNGDSGIPDYKEQKVYSTCESK